MAKRRKKLAALSPLENAVLRIIWKRDTATADEVRNALRPEHDLKDSTVRTLLRRLESKGVLEHSTHGRTFVYRSPVEPMELANEAVRGVIARFCAGSVSSLLIGMVNEQIITADELRELAAQIESAEKQSVRKR